MIESCHGDTCEHHDTGMLLFIFVQYTVLNSSGYWMLSFKKQSRQRVWQIEFCPRIQLINELNVNPLTFILKQIDEYSMYPQCRF